ncbi:MAG: hypothetical protein HC840_32770 [Leptolyngbyaceae cyanobacterium RM2_2_4]|nr:hypothetical protein [Leptolyngbyaceae cyanobacterium SM1_4_3]NJN89030.1 hypothetical protein [Leptolyngbyaceae cyanobacterium SL_5_14]NJO53391.1 hypothetical protein [Leptolyngbyaceae cyanobacterium RM2_2_4]
MSQIDEPRQTAKALIKASIPPMLWDENASFVASLRQSLEQHSITTHPAIAALNQGRFDKHQMQRIHLEYRYAIVQIFTDALLAAQFQTLQLEPRLKPGSKMYARFLLTLNDLDEFGFVPGVNRYGYYQGNPSGAHYPLFEGVLDEIGVSLEQRLQYVPTSISCEVRKYLEDTYSDLCAVTSLLAVAEEEVVLFSAPLRENSRCVGVEVSSGYYLCHGTSDDQLAQACDDTHEDDLWYIVMQAILPERYSSIAELCLRYCDLWVEFWDTQMSLLQEQLLVSV